ncbi:PREDICTED: MLP-like protein 328 isoform X1 [Prunus mume]|uniref:MLP-like protein 328 isoform X1 n=1 Tax=Prunus mume TaxID=102107 RepID=A0ABM1LXC4_PRUMU|nr:PREDICTED: MLP-like protein 328 isoform X1 [Prunus mume]
MLFNILPYTYQISKLISISMALHGFIGTQIELKSPADKFYKIFKGQAHLIPNVSSGHIKGVQVHEGDWETHGSVKIWNYHLGDEVGTLKEKVKYDDENKAATLTGLDGEMFKYYKSIKGIFQFAQMGDVSVANLTIHYEKRNTDVEAPDRYVGLMVTLVRDLDAHFAKA